MRWILTAGAAGGFLTVALGAFGAHVLEAHLTPDRMETFRTATFYLGLHALALLLVGVLARDGRPGWQWPARLFTAGLLLFSGSLYLLALSGIRWLGAVTPFGGLAFLAGWVLLAMTAWRHPGR